MTESIPSGALKVAEECKRLLIRARNAAFDCGNWTDEDVDAPLYEPVLKASQDARTAALAAIDQLAALASPSPATGAPQWLPIESAPKNGTWLLVAGPDHTGAKRMVCRWMGDWEWESADDGFGAYINPTHWMPLPAPPAASQMKPEDKHG